MIKLSGLEITREAPSSLQVCSCLFRRRGGPGGKRPGLWQNIGGTVGAIYEQLDLVPAVDKNKEMYSHC